MKFILSLLLLIMTGSAVTGQVSIDKEKFEYGFVQKKKEGQIIYRGMNHSFMIEFTAENIQTTPGAAYIIVNRQNLQTTSVPIEDSSLNFNKLSQQQEKDILTKYLTKRMDYFDRELKIFSRNLKMEWVTIKPNLWLVWYFDIENLKSDDAPSSVFKKQLYASTICFNQILDLNIPLFRTDDFPDAKTLVTYLMNHLKLTNKRI